MHMLYSLKETLDDEGSGLLTVSLFMFELGIELAV